MLESVSIAKFKVVVCRANTDICLVKCTVLSVKVCGAQQGSLLTRDSHCSLSNLIYLSTSPRSTTPCTSSWSEASEMTSTSL